MIVLFILNALVAAAGIVLALTAADRPSRLFAESRNTPGERFYARMYAGKAVPLGALAAIVPFTASGPTAALVLAAAACSQAADTALGFGRHDPRQAWGSLAATVVHGIVAALLW